MKRRKFELSLGQIEQRIENLKTQLQNLENSREEILSLSSAVERFVGKYWLLKDASLQDSPDYRIKIKDLDYSSEDDSYILVGPGYVAVYEDGQGIVQSTSNLVIEIPRSMWKEWLDYIDNRELEESEFIADWKSFRSRMDTELRKWIVDEEETEED
jgi:hypothetical protein